MVDGGGRVAPRGEPAGADSTEQQQQKQEEQEEEERQQQPAADRAQGEGSPSAAENHAPQNEDPASAPAAEGSASSTPANVASTAGGVTSTGAPIPGAAAEAGADVQTGTPSAAGTETSSVAAKAATAAAAAAPAAVPSPTYRPTGISVKVQNGHCRMLDPVRVEELDAYNEATGAWLSLIRPYRRPSGAAAAAGGAAAGSGIEDNGDDGEDDNDEEDDANIDDADGTNNGGRHKRGGRGGRKRSRRGSAATDYLYADGPAHHPLAGLDREALWTRLQPPDGQPPSWRDWRESLPPHVLERLAEASVPPSALRVAGSKRPRRSVVAAYDVNTATGSGANEREEDGRAHPVEVGGSAMDQVTLPSPFSGVATKFVVEPTNTQSLPPVVLPSPPADDRTTTDALASIPKAVRHLPLDSKVDIFDRKTGKVLGGRSAVPVRDLAAVLRTHASFEPVVPPPPIEEAAAEAVAEAAKRAATVRQGRTAPNVTVNATVEPQVRVRASAMEGREVIVTEGRLRGLVGKIEACLPGGWYVLSDLLGRAEQGVEHVVSSASLDLLENSHQSTASFVNTFASEGDGTLPPAKDVVGSFQSTIEKIYSNPIRQMSLRLEAMTNEKESIAKDIGLDEEGKLRDIDEAKANTGLHGLKIYQLQQRWERLDKDIEEMKTKLSEYKSAGEEIQSGVATIVGDQT